MRLFGREYSRAELLRRVGGLNQLGGAQLLEHAEGPARGVRYVDVRTGSGFRFGPVVDRGLDVGWCEFRGVPLAWTSPNGLVGPWYFEGVRDELAWARVALGGLFNTAGLLTIGPPQTLASPQYSSVAIESGTHNRIALTPAAGVRFGEEWRGDECVVRVEGEVRQHLPYGENLVLSRRYEAALGGSSFTIRDVVRNDGYFTMPHQILYHFNIGFPIVDERSELVAAVARVDELAFSADPERAPAAERYRLLGAPKPGFGHDGFRIEMVPDADARVGVAVVNPALAPEDGGLGVYLRYRHDQLPAYIAWRMMAEGLYAVGLEPASSPFGAIDELERDGWRVRLEPGEERHYELEFGVLDGGDAIDGFRRSLPAP